VLISWVPPAQACGGHRRCDGATADGPVPLLACAQAAPHPAGRPESGRLGQLGTLLLTSVLDELSSARSALAFEIRVRKGYPCQEDASGPPQLAGQGEGIAVRDRSPAVGPGLPTLTVTRPALVLRWPCWAGPEYLRSATVDERHRSRSALSVAVSRLYASARALLHNHGSSRPGQISRNDQVCQSGIAAFGTAFVESLPLAVVGHTHRDRRSFQSSESVPRTEICVGYKLPASVSPRPARSSG
jgi:hypothetical protein